MPEAPKTYATLRPALGFGLAELQTLEPNTAVALAYAALMQACSAQSASS